MPKKYRALRIVSGVYQILGVIVMLMLIIAGVIQLLQQYSPNFIGGISLIIGGIVAGLGMIGFGELITLFIDLEENTRITARYMQHRTTSRSVEKLS